MLLNDVPVVVLAMAVLVAPGVVWAWRCYPAASRLTRLAVGLALGVAFQMHICALLAVGPRITRVSVWGATLFALALAGLLAWRFPRPFPHMASGRRRALTQGTQVAIVIVAMAALWTIPLAYHQLPQGWDPSFHSLLASVTVDTGRLPSWQPFEPITSNYPYGPHVLMAEISLLTGLAPNQVFGPLLNTIIPLLTGLAMYCFARRALGRHSSALGAIAAYGFLGNWGAIDYGRWGGLPNALGFFLLLVFLTMLFAPGALWMRVIIGGALLGAIPLAHHHVMLTTVALLGAYALYLATRLLTQEFTWRRQQATQANTVNGWRITFTGALHTSAGRAFMRLALTSMVALLTVAYYAIPFALRASQLGDTSALTAVDDFSGDIFGSNGALLWGLAALGMGLLLLRFVGSSGVFAFLSGGGAPRSRRPVQALNILIGHGNLARVFIALASGTLLLAFFFGYDVYRMYSLTHYHHPYTLFTPTRFLTDLTYFLAIYAGVGLAALWRLARWLGVVCAAVLRGVGYRERTLVTGQTMSGAAFNWVSATLTLALRCALIVICIAVGMQALANQIPTRGGQDDPLLATSGVVAPGELAAFAWVRDHTPQDTLIVNLDADAQWAPYFTRREAYLAPIPISEFVAGYITQKRLIVGALLHAARQTPPNRIMALLDTGSALPALLNRPLAVITVYPLPGVAPGYLAYRVGVERVYVLPGLFALTPYGPPPAFFAQAQWNATYTAFTLTLPKLADAWMICQAQAGAAVTLTLDGRAISSLCDGLAANLPALAAPGFHRFAGRLLHSVQRNSASRWFDLLLFTRHV
ncbi:MAG TPA: hypothetical protein VMV29_01145 [Ktedonobacterales bacterium]|nr:hypothetical protein [Ktedonobacterales bacterium]